MTEDKVGGKKIFKPIIATAKKVAEAGGEDVLKLEIPYQEDAEVLIKAATEIKDDKGIEKDNIVERITESKRSDNMEEKEIEKIMEKKLKEMEIEKTIKNIGVTSSNVKEKVSEMDSKLEGFRDELNEKVSSTIGTLGEIKKHQEEACSGVECIKNDINTLKKEYEDKMLELTNNLAKIQEKVGKENVLCSGPGGCNSEIPVGSSFCPNCGKRIKKWSDMPNWRPYPDRVRVG